MGHHAFANLQDLVGVAARCAAAQVGYPQITGVHEANKIGAFIVQEGVGPDRVSGSFATRPGNRGHTWAACSSAAWGFPP